MTKNIDDIVKLLPKGLSKTGINEIASLIDSVIEDRVSEEVKLLESKVRAFLRTKLEDLREIAEAEFVANDDTAQAMQVYEAIKTLVAADVESSNVDSVINSYEDENEKLANTVEELNSTLANYVGENKVLKGKVSSLNESNNSLTEQAKLPFKSSESAFVINNENSGVKVTDPEENDNMFLTEEVIRLSKLGGM